MICPLHIEAQLNYSSSKSVKSESSSSDTGSGGTSTAFGNHPHSARFTLSSPVRPMLT